MSRTVLVAMSDPGELIQVAGWLGQAGYRCLTAREFHEAVRLLPASRVLRLLPANRLRLVVADLRLGAYNGLHLLMRARSNQADVPVLLAGLPDIIAARETAAFGAAEYVSKPLKRATLLRHAESLMGLTPTLRMTPAASLDRWAADA